MAPAPSGADDGPTDDKSLQASLSADFSNMQSYWASFVTSTSTLADGSIALEGKFTTVTTTNSIPPTYTTTSPSLSTTTSALLNNNGGAAAQSPSYNTPSVPVGGSQSYPTSESGQYPYPKPQSEHHGAPFPAIIAVGIIIPLILFGLSAVGCFYCLRRQRARVHPEGMAAGGTMGTMGTGPQMKNVGRVQTERAYVGQSSAVPPMAMSTPSPPTSPASSGPQPVILSTTMNNTYYTGIDTSDHISLTDQRSHTSAESVTGDEPPPPYRPRSVPPISRETSVRTTGPMRNTSVLSNRNDPMSGAGLIRGDAVRSPFDDPESDDDALSQISTIRSYPRRAADQLSVVSDMSYQEEEQAQASHSNV
jgi:hypothetical protein